VAHDTLAVIDEIGDIAGATAQAPLSRDRRPAIIRERNL